MNEKIEGFLYVVGLLILAVMLMGYPIMLLWNWLMPNIFGLHEIGFWQAVGLNTLCTLLFKPTVSSKND